MKRLLAILAVGALVAAGCGGDDDSAGSTSTSTTSTTAATTTSGQTPTTETTVPVQVFFSTGDGTDCAQVEAIIRLVEPPALLRGAMEQLLAGPTPDEEADGFTSWFGPETAGMLISADIDHGTARVDFESFAAVIPNASTSCGSAQLLAQLDATATQFPTVDDTLYSFDGSPEAFYGWLQLDVPGGGPTG